MIDDAWHGITTYDNCRSAALYLERRNE